jgi:predicted DsbA family dithiol-disulfide isomerase
MDLCWVAFPLHPETPEEGQSLEELFRGRIDIDEVMARLETAAQEAGLPFLMQRKMTYNSRLAQELSKWAELKEVGDLFHRTVFQAYFVEGLNIGKIPVLLDLVKAMGLPVEEARLVLEERRYRESVDRDWARSREIGIQAVPTLLLNGLALAGAHPFVKMADFVASAGIQRKNTP